MWNYGIFRTGLGHSCNNRAFLQSLRVFSKHIGHFCNIAYSIFAAFRKLHFPQYNLFWGGLYFFQFKQKLKRGSQQSGNQGIIREFTKWVFFLKQSGNYQGIWTQVREIMEIWSLAKFWFFYYNFQTLLFALSLLFSNE